MKKNIHIGYGDSATDCLNEAILNHGLIGDGAIPSRDDFTQGPISKCAKQEDVNQRIEYWKSVDSILGFRFEPEVFYGKSMKILDNLKADEITIWVGDSCHDILATGWLLSYLKDRNLKWFIVNLAEVEKVDMTQGQPAVNLAMYLPSDIAGLYKYRKPIDSGGKFYFTSILEKAALENSHYRIKENNEIISVDEDYYDAYILGHIGDEFDTARSVIGKILQDGKHRISDTTVEWNIRKMIGMGWVEYRGDLNGMEYYSIRKKM